MEDRGKKQNNQDKKLIKQQVQRPNLLRSKNAKPRHIITIVHF